MEKKIWHDKYPAGVASEVDVTRYQSVAQILDECFEKYADQTAYINMGASLTFGEVDKLSRDFAAYLQDLGLEKGDRIALQMPNILQYPIALFGAIRAGLIVVNTNPLYTAREMKHQFKDSGVKAIVILDNFASKLDEIIADTNIEHVILTRLGDLLGGLKGFITNFVVKYIKKMVPAYSLPTAVPFKQALAIGSDCRYLQPEIKSDDVGFLQYTGGTTGVSKGATLSHGNLVANMLVMEEWNGGLLHEKEEIIITALPLYHIFAFTINCLAMVSVGGTNVLITNPRDMKGFLKEISKYKFTVITGVNTLFNGMLNHPGIEEVDFSKLKLAAGGGMAVQVAVNDAWKARTGKPILEGYGLSETSPVLSTNPNDGTDQIGTIGVPIPNTDMKIMDDQGNEVAMGERGEICAKGPQVMRGYWNKLDENDKYFFPGGWFRTGDIGIMREDGFFKIVDRKKDMILVSGFNVFPNEIEDVVAHHPGVLEVAAIGVPDEKSTEAVKIFVVKKDPAVTVDDIRAYCKENLTGYKVPKHVEFRDELPKSNVGKIIRRMLKEE